MVFVLLPSSSRHPGAFGSFQGSKTGLHETLDRLRERCRLTSARRAKPSVGPSLGKEIDRLRHLYAHAMQIDVIFKPLKGWCPVRDQEGGIHLPTCVDRRFSCNCRKKKAPVYLWQNNPVWGHAPPGAKRKCNRLASLLHVIVENGHLLDLRHDLTRLATIVWQSSMKNFLRLCRRITARIAEAVRSTTFVLKSPEPNAPSGGLTFNPAISCAIWYHTRKPSKKVNYIPRYIPPFRRKGDFPYAGDSMKLLKEQWPRPQDSFDAIG